MQVRTVLGVSAILACIGGIMLLATLFGGINLVEYATQLAVGLTLVALGVAYWMFRPRIDRWTEITHNNRTPRIIEHWALFSHAKRNPDVRREVIHPIHHYNSRQELPSFSKMLSITGNSVDFVGLDFRIIIHQFMSVIRDLIYRNVRVTFLLLDPNSRYVDVQSKTLFAASDLKESIQKSLGLL